MQMLKNNKGVTLIALVVTIIIMLIIAGVTLSTGLIGTDDATANSQVTELNMVAHAILERYTRASITKEEKYPGVKTSAEDLATMESEIGNNGIIKKGNAEDYHTLTPDNGLKDLGITNVVDTYIVNYKTGEAFNLTKIKTKNAQLLYISNTSNDSEYVADGLILHYDGINNTGNGHSDTATTWKDLSGNGKDGTLSGFNDTGESGWQSSYLKFDGIDDVVYKKMQVSGENQTIEITCQYYSGTYILRSDAGERTYIYNDTFTKGSPTPKYFYIKNLKGGIGTRTLKYYKENNKMYGEAYYNSVETNEIKVEFENGNNGTYIAVGSFYFNPNQLSKIDTYSVRVYNRALTNAEVQHNYEIDKTRFNIE